MTSPRARKLAELEKRASHLVAAWKATKAMAIRRREIAMPVFLDALKHGTVSRAADAAGISKMTAYDWYRSDPEFAKAWDDAVETSTDHIEQALYDRAVHGVARPVYQGGQLVGHTQEYSDTAGIALLKGRRAQYNDRVQHVGADGAPLQPSLQAVQIIVGDGSHVELRKLEDKRTATDSVTVKAEKP